MGKWLNVDLVVVYVRQSYTQKRWLLLKPVIRAHLEGVAKSRETASLARTGAAVLTRICQLETQLYDTFFGAPEEEVRGAMRM